MLSVVRFGLAAALLSLALSVSAPAAAGSANAIRFAGREYIPAADWASVRGLEVRWLKRDQSLRLGNDFPRCQLTADSREAQINGVQVWLSYPVLLRAGNLYVSQLDCQTALQPAMFPPRNAPGAKVRSVCLDPGHGGKDPGNQAGSSQEKKHTLLLAQEVRDCLSRAGLKVFLTRHRDSFVDLPMRPEIARRRKADLFVSLHFNSSESSRSSVQGSEVYCLTPSGAASTNAQGERGGGEWCLANRHNAENIFLACQIQKALTRSLGVEDRGVRRARFAVLRDSPVPAVLVEAGFLSHPSEGRKIVSPEYRRQMARAITDGVLAYKRAVERGQQ
jgi:N-acetylmuramoyl-L-alanine amidase